MTKLYIGIQICHWNFSVLFQNKSNVIGCQRIRGSANKMNVRYRKEIGYYLIMWGCSNKDPLTPLYL
jgi:hypothetical protein